MNTAEQRAAQASDIELAGICRMTEQKITPDPRFMPLVEWINLVGAARRELDRRMFATPKHAGGWSA